PQPFLLVVPASLLGNWMAEFEKFAPNLRVFAAHPSRTPREQLDQAMAHPAKILSGHHAVLTTYGLIQRSPALQSHPWQAVILDEAQAIKNAGTAQARAIKKLQAPWRLALTGTPIENRPGDLWSLFDFLNPGLLGSASAFATLLKTLTDSTAAPPRGYAPLRRLIQPYILRRMKTDKSIIADLPDKTEITATCTLSRKQAIIYGKLVEQLKKDLADPLLDPMTRRSLVVGYLIKFKQVCNHSSHWSGDGVYAPADSGKFGRLAELCHDIADRQERVLIFTQFREIIDPLHSFLTTVFKRPGLILHGGTAVTARQKLVDQFQTPGGPPFFILSVKAGGTGLTLTAASHVIHFDRWWNPAVENQATDRAYRIGQKRNVLVHKFVTTGTLEERIDRLIEDKKATAHELLTHDPDQDPTPRALTELSNEELINLVSLHAESALDPA
ncbi:MAG: SNF2-related protein, partial [Verrucomicrobiales bacterium]|nr:SNF2-related protein [Verrucomicrobiales bacterium]